MSQYKAKAIIAQRKLEEATTFINVHKEQLEAQDVKNFLAKVEEYKQQLEQLEGQYTQHQEKIAQLETERTTLEEGMHRSTATISAILEHFDGEEDRETLYHYEQKMIQQALLNIEQWLEQYDCATTEVKPVLQPYHAQIIEDQKRLENLLQDKAVVAHPSGRDYYYDSYTLLHPDLSPEEAAQSAEQLNQWLEEQETLKEEFKTPIELDVPHVNQNKLENGGTLCKYACELMVTKYAKNAGFEVKDFKVKNFNSGGYISVAREDKSKINEVVQKEGDWEESITNDALDYQETAQEGYQYILDQLNLSRPVVVGVDHTYNRILTGHKNSTKREDGGYNNDKTTDHFIVVVGKGVENGVPYLIYKDPGTQHGDNNQENRLYPIWKGGDLYWRDTASYSFINGDKKRQPRDYVISSVCLYD